MTIRRTARTAALALALIAAAPPWARPDVATRAEESPLIDETYRTACGPISALVALRTLGYEATLQGMVVECGWKEGEQTKLSTLVRVLSGRPGLSVRPARVTPEALASWIKARARRVAILPVRKADNGTDHALCVVGHDDGQFEVIDYPELAFEVSEAQLADFWDGEVLLVSAESGAWPASVAWQLLPGATVGLLAGLAVCRSAWTPGRRAAAAKKGELPPC